jgi:hypothetical protein
VSYLGWTKLTAAGDVIGCGVDMTIGRAFFTRNGKLLGESFSS